MQVLRYWHQMLKESFKDLRRHKTGALVSWAIITVITTVFYLVFGSEQAVTDWWQGVLFGSLAALAYWLLRTFLYIPATQFAHKDWEIAERDGIINDYVNQGKLSRERNFTASQLVSYFVRESQILETLGHGESYRLQFDVQQAACDGRITVWAKQNTWGAPYTEMPRTLFETHGFSDLAAWLAYEYLDFEAGRETEEHPTADIRIKQENKIGGSRSTVEYVEPMFCEQQIRKMWPPRRGVE